MLEIEGIVMRRTKYSESSLIVDILSRDQDVLTLITSGLNSKTGQHRSSVLQLGHHIKCTIYYKEGRNMHRIKEVSPASIMHEIPFQLEKGTLLLFMIELMRNSIGKKGSDLEHYEFLSTEINELDALAEGLAYFPLGFSIRLSKILGFEPNIQSYEGATYFDLKNGVFQAGIPDHPHYLSIDDTAIFSSLAKAAFKKNTVGLKINKQKRKYMLDQLMQYYRLHIDNFRIPNSQQILNTVFSA